MPAAETFSCELLIWKLPVPVSVAPVRERVDVAAEEDRAGGGGVEDAAARSAG